MSRFVDCPRLKQNFEFLDKPVSLCNEAIHNTNDSEIHCLKDGGAATAARATVTLVTAQLLSRADDEGDRDPVAELEEDDDELNENEIVMEDC